MIGDTCIPGAVWLAFGLGFVLIVAGFVLIWKGSPPR